MQLERGLSAGYVVAEGKDKYKNRLLKQYKLTDKTYNDYINYINNNSEESKRIDELTFYKNKSKIKEVLKQLHIIKSIRNSVLNSSISLKKR